MSICRMLSPPGMTYSPVAGNTMPVQASHSCTVPVMVCDWGCGGDDLAAEPPVGAQPGIQRGAVLAGPARERLNLGEWVGRFEGRADRGEDPLAAWKRWAGPTEPSTGPGAAGLRALADHLDQALAPLKREIQALSEQAAAALALRDELGPPWPPRCRPGAPTPLSRRTA